MINRLILLRKDILKLSQKNFGEKIGLKQNSYSNIENKIVGLTERNIKLICQEFNVNENWLRNGIEPVFNNETVTIGDRLKTLRTELLEDKKLTRKVFGDTIGVSEDVIKNIEYNRVEIKNHMIKLICQTFNVNENWLRNGVGDIFNEDNEDASINELIKKYNINSDEVDLIKRLNKLDDDTRAKIINFVFALAKENIDKIDINKLIEFAPPVKEKVKIIARGEGITYIDKEEFDEIEKTAYTPTDEEIDKFFN